MKSITHSRPVRDGRSVRWDHHRRERRVELLRAARAAVHELGPEASMDEIAAHAGTSKSVFYRYFGDRAGLQVAVSRRVTAQMERHLLEAADEAEDPAASLHRMVEAYLALAATSPHVYAFATTAPAGREGDGPLDGFFDRLYALLDVGLTRHLGAEPDADSPVHLWPRGAVGLVRATAETWLRSPAERRPPAPELAAAITGWLLHGPPGSPAGTPTATPTPTPTVAPEGEVR